MKTTLRYNLVDVFTDTPLTGNPLAVFTRGLGLSAVTMQRIAREMNLSETVFFFPPESGGHAKVRIFTPHVELPFAGHPIIGSAWVMGQPMELPVLRLETGAGVIEVAMSRQGGQLDLARMTQPLPRFAPCEFGPALYAALGCPAPVGLLPVIHANNGPHHVFVEVGSREVLDGLNPDFGALARLVQAGVGVFVQQGDTCFVRYFAPHAGVNEDPGTGSAAGPLAALLVQHGRLGSERQLTVYQGQGMGRPSTLLAEAKLTEQGFEWVTVAGRAVVVGRGEMSL